MLPALPCPIWEPWGAGAAQAETAVSPEAPLAAPAVKAARRRRVTAYLLWEAMTMAEIASRPKAWESRVVFPAETAMRHRVGNSQEERLLELM